MYPILSLSALLAVTHSVSAYPGMAKVMHQIRQTANNDGVTCTEPIGDLITLPDSNLTETATLIKSIIIHNTGDPVSTEPSTAVPDLTDPACHQDTCCIWQHVSNDLQPLFRDSTGRCTKQARQAIRLMFHDSAAWDKFSTWGGADGSIVLAAEERTRFENGGLVEMIKQVEVWYKQYRDAGYNISMADLIQVAANTATVSCPQGPRVRLFVGRQDDPTAAPTRLLPSPFASASQLIGSFANKTICSRGLVALLGAHTVSRQTAVDTSRPEDPQDSTPGVWDTAFFNETLAVDAPTGVFRFQSDLNLAQDNKTNGDWKTFAGTDGQALWNHEYSREFIRLSLLGVNNINKLTECTRVLPQSSSLQ